MPNIPSVLRGLRMPVIAAPLFIISNPKLVIEQCKAGIVGSMPALNARQTSQLDEWLAEITGTLADYNARNPDRPAAPFAINQIVHKTNARMEQDLELLVKYKVPIVITSMGARPEVNDVVHGYGGIVLHDVTTNTYARKAIEKGADGLVAVAAGAGGHAGNRNPFALVQEIREWYDGPLALAGAIAHGRSILAALAMGADFAYIGSPFIATHEANASDAYKQAIVDCTSDDIVYTKYFTGVYANYLAPSIRNAGLDPAALPEREANPIDYKSEITAARPWKDIWGCGQGIGIIREITGTAALVDRLCREFTEAKELLRKTWL